MLEKKKVTRRKILKAGLTGLAVSSVSSGSSFAATKVPGEIRVLFLVGDIWHNSVRQESHWRRVLGVTGWRLMFAQSSQFVTPAVLADTDLFIFARYAGGDSLGWSPEGIIEKRPRSAPWMTDEQQDAIYDNVTKRGMGIIPVHCSMWNPDRPKFMELIGVKEPLMHGPIMNTSFYDLNRNHPITKGLEPFETEDEIFGANMAESGYVPLMRANQKGWSPAGIIDPPLDRPAAWAREAGNGRVVVLNCLASHECYWKREMKELMWRSAHWAMKMDIPESGLIEGRSQDRE
ncbi:ThuA domain-containing protein [Candidatus Latescibacterota bacterium]